MAKLDWQNPAHRGEMAAKQIGRLAQMHGYPKWDQEALEELIKAMGTAKSEEAARDCVQAILEDATVGSDCPLPADIRGLLIARSQKPVGCAKCDGVGWLIVERGGLTGAAPCECHPASRPKAQKAEAVDHRKIAEMRTVEQVYRGGQ